jgi:hypothetical protein
MFCEHGLTGAYCSSRHSYSAICGTSHEGIRRSAGPRMKVALGDRSLSVNARDPDLMNASGQIPMSARSGARAALERRNVTSGDCGSKRTTPQGCPFSHPHHRRRHAASTSSLPESRDRGPGRPHPLGVLRARTTSRATKPRPGALIGSRSMPCVSRRAHLRSKSALCAASTGLLRLSGHPMAPVEDR